MDVYIYIYTGIYIYIYIYIWACSYSRQIFSYKQLAVCSPVTVVSIFLFLLLAVGQGMFQRDTHGSKCNQVDSPAHGEIAQSTLLGSEDESEGPGCQGSLAGPLFPAAKPVGKMAICTGIKLGSLYKTRHLPIRLRNI